MRHEACGIGHAAQRAGHNAQRCHDMAHPTFWRPPDMAYAEVRSRNRWVHLALCLTACFDGHPCSCLSPNALCLTPYSPFSVNSIYL